MMKATIRGKPGSDPLPDDRCQRYKRFLIQIWGECYSKHRLFPIMTVILLIFGLIMYFNLNTTYCMLYNIYFHKNAVGKQYRQF